jgi:hypothetical protein
MHVYVILSVLDTVSKPLSYGIRSVFTHEERFSQTVETIKSIRDYDINAYIILVEGRGYPLTNNEKLLLNVDDICEIFNINALYDIQSPYKLKGETRMIIEFFKSNQYDKIKNTISLLFKINGRYKLNKDFTINIYSNDKITLKYNKEHNHVCTVAYSIPPLLLEYYNNQATYINSNYCEHQLECVMFDITSVLEQKKFKIVDKLNIEGFVSVSGEYWCG